MTNQQAVTPRSPIAVESLESRICLSSPMGGGDVADHLGHDAAAPAHHHGRQARAAQPWTKASLAALSQADRPAGNPAAAAAAAPAVHQTVIELPGLRLTITVRSTFRFSMFDGPAIKDDYGNSAPPLPVGGGGSPANVTASKVTNSRATPSPVTVSRGSAELVQLPADANDADGRTADATNVSVVEEAAATGPLLATATATIPAAQTLAARGSAVIERLTSTWHDGSATAAAVVLSAGETASDALDAQQWLPVEAFVAGAVDAATNLLAPVAETASSVVAAVTPLAGAAAYEIAHMGSPFALLADSLATFVEESAAVSNVAATASANPRGPWALTAGVIAADVVILTYLYRRKTTRRRVSLAPVGVPC